MRLIGKIGKDGGQAMGTKCCSHSTCTTYTSNASGRCDGHPVTIEQVLAAMPVGYCCDDAEDTMKIVDVLRHHMGFSARSSWRLDDALYGQPWCTDDDNDRRMIAETVCKVLNG